MQGTALIVRQLLTERINMLLYKCVRSHLLLQLVLIEESYMKNAGIKVVTIGGGSSYTPELVEGFIKRYEELPIKELWLVDIEEGRTKLEIIGALAKRMIQKAGIPLEIFTTTDRRLALKDADFVTTQIRVGGMDGRIKDEKIPLSHGALGQETNGAGGLFLGLRTIPVILDIAKDIKELCPEAWLINFSNPAGMVTEALLRYSDHKKVVGLCNVPVGIHRALAEVMEVEPERIRIDFAGLNHMVFGLRTYLDGEDISDQIPEILIKSEGRITMSNIPPVEWEPEFVRGLKVLPCPYHRYYYKTAEMVAEAVEGYEKNGTRAEVVKALEEELFKIYKDENLDIKPGQLESRGGAYYSDAACSLINSIYNNKGDMQTVNTMNNGAVSDLPDESAVEISCRITDKGPVPITVGELPVAVKGLIQQIKSFERLAAEAAVTGDYSTGVLALAINPLTFSDKLAKKLFDELLEAHKEYLPQFRR